MIYLFTLGFSDKLLELRIKLQKPLQSSWRFPQCDNIHQFQNLSAMFSEEQNEGMIFISH